MNVSFIGYGNLAKAIATRLTHQNRYIVSASAPSLAIAINQDNVNTHYDNKEVAKNADVIILAVKPKLMSIVLKEINPYIPAKCLLISVAAGLNLDWFKKHCNPQQSVIRTIPNTPAAVGQAATPMIANEYTLPQQKKWAELIFSSIGITTWAQKEEDMDSFTALSGSGPAYVFLFIEALVKASKELGLEEPIAKKFAIQMMSGAIQLVEHSELNLSQLRDKVATPGGTTAAALDILHGKLENLILSALSAAKHRSQEIAKSL